VEPSQVELIIRQLEVNRTSYNDAVEKSYAQSRQNGSELAQILELLKQHGLELKQQ
jgi:2-iminoacetate synthase ThiH